MIDGHSSLSRDEGLVCRLSSLLYAPAHINGSTVNFLVDSGSDISLISPAVLRDIPGHKPKVYPTGELFKTASNEQMSPTGIVHLSVNLAGHTCRLKLFVAEMGSVPALLGLDAMREHGISPDILNGTLTYKGSQLSLHNAREASTSRICLLQSVTIPPNSMKLVQCRPPVGFSKIHNADLLYLQNDEASFERRGTLVMEGLTELQKGKLSCWLMNPTTDDISVPKGSLVASVFTDEIDAISTPEDGLEYALGDVDDLSCDGTNLLQEAELSNIDVDLPHSSHSESEEVAHDVNDNTSRVNLVHNFDEDEHDACYHVLNINKLTDSVRSMVDRASSTLTVSQLSDLASLVNDYNDIFSVDGKIGRTSTVTHRIDTGDHYPIRLPPRRAAHKQRAIIEKEIKDMLDKGVISPSNSPWASPIVLVVKKDGTIRFCIDYRLINKITRKDAYPLPRIDAMLDSFKGAKYFCTLDLNCAYWQIQMHKQDKAKTAFTTHLGLWEFNVMPYGLCNAPATFERLMENVLRDLIDKACLVYLDDIVVYGSTVFETLTNLQKVFDCLRKAGLTLKPKKCDLFQTSVKFLGHVISETGIATDPSKVQVVKDWPQPTKLTHVRSFLGFSGYYRRFIPDYAHIAAPLTMLTKKSTKFVWGTAQEEAFNRLKHLLSSAPVMAHPNPDEEFIVDTDASNVGIGGVLSQIVDGEERVVAYASRCLSQTQRNYCTTKRELLAVVVFVTQTFRHYLWGVKSFRLRTDHASLRWLVNFKNPEGVLAHWISALSEFNPVIEHRSGHRHGNADGLSRIPE